MMITGEVNGHSLASSRGRIGLLIAALFTTCVQHAGSVARNLSSSAFVYALIIWGKLPVRMRYSAGDRLGLYDAPQVA